jgi:hypothetical protein
MPFDKSDRWQNTLPGGRSPAVPLYCASGIEASGPEILRPGFPPTPTPQNAQGGAKSAAMLPHLSTWCSRAALEYGGAQTPSATKSP